MDIYKQLLAGLVPLGRRLRWRTGIELLTRGAWLVLLAAAAVLFLARLIPLENYQWLALGVVTVSLVTWVGYSLLHRVTPFAVARRADEELGLRDRLATALALNASPGRISHANPELVARQFDDALAQLKHIEPSRAFPPRVDRRRVLAALVACAAIVGLLVLPNPMDAVIAERREITQTAQAQAQELEKLAQEVARNNALDPKAQEQLLKELRDLAAQLKSNPGDAKQALAELAQFQEELRGSLDLNRLSEAAALDALAQQMADLAHSTDAPQDASELAQLLEQLAAQVASTNPDALSSEQRVGLTQALEQTAAQVAAGNPDLARALAQLAQSLNSNASGEQLQQAISQATNALQDAAQQQALQRALAQALNQADEAQSRMAQASNAQTSSGQTSSNQASNSQTSNGQTSNGQTSNQASNGQGQAQGQGNQSGQGNQGQGQGQGQGKQVGGGGGTNANSLPPSQRTGSMGNPTGPNKSFDTQDIDTVYSPFHVGQGEQQTVSGQDTGSGQTTTRTDKSPLPGANNPARVPYSEVYQQYLDIAGRAMERSYIPSGLKDYVKEYFSALEP